MSRKLGALVLAMGILACSMGLKTVLTSHSSKTVVAANTPAPPPPPPQKSTK